MLEDSKHETKLELPQPIIPISESDVSQPDSRKDEILKHGLDKPNHELSKPNLPEHHKLQKLALTKTGHFKADHTDPS